MTDDRFAPRPDEFLDLTEDQAALLFRMGRRRPIDELIDRLSEDDGPAYYENALAPALRRTFGAAWDHIADGAAELDELVAIKEASKRLNREADTERDRLVAMTGYFVSVAAALILHNKLICSRPRIELEPIMLDLATVLPPPLSDLAGRAANPPSYSSL